MARASEVVGVSEEVLRRELKQPRRDRGETQESPAPAAARVRASERRTDFGADGSSAERELVRLLIHRRQHVEAVAESCGTDSFRDPRLAEIFNALVASP